MTHGLQRREALAAASGAAAIHLLVAAAAIVAGLTGTYAWHDEVNYHMPAIRQFASELPSPVLADYKSATAPGYHLLVALFLHGGVDGAPLHFVNALFGAALAAIVAAFVARRAGGLVGLLAGATLGLSPYTVNPSVFIATDNPAALLVVLAFMAVVPIAAGTARQPVRCGLLAAATAMAAVLVRQVAAYSAGFTGAAFVARACAERRWPRVGETVGSILALIPALLVIGLFVATWGGLVPPSFQQYHASGGNTATPVYALAIVAVWGSAAFLSIPGYLREFFSRRALLIGVLASLTSCAVPTSFLMHVRFGGTLWTIASKFPAVADRSLFLVPMAGIGAAALGAYLRLWSRCPDRAARGLAACALFAFVGMVLAQTTNSQCFERYMQPLTLVFMAIAAAAIAGRNARWWPYAAAAGVSAAWTALSLLKASA